MPDVWHELQVVNRGLLRLRRSSPVSYQTLCLRVKGREVDERLFSEAKRKLSAGIVEFGALYPKAVGQFENHAAIGTGVRGNL